MEKGSLQQKLWNSSPRRDSRPSQTRDVLQTRERTSAEAAIKGRRWYARMLLQMQTFPTNREASWHLIKASRQLIADTRERIRVTKNAMAFTRVPRKLIN